MKYDRRKADDAFEALRLLSLYPGWRIVSGGTDGNDHVVRIENADGRVIEGRGRRQSEAMHEAVSRTSDPDAELDPRHRQSRQ